jgi:hypothetical protein
VVSKVCEELQVIVKGICHEDLECDVSVLLQKTSEPDGSKAAMAELVHDFVSTIQYII